MIFRGAPVFFGFAVALERTFCCRRSISILLVAAVDRATAASMVGSPVTFKNAAWAFLYAISAARSSQSPGEPTSSGRCFGLLDGFRDFLGIPAARFAPAAAVAPIGFARCSATPHRPTQIEPACRTYPPR